CFNASSRYMLRNVSTAEYLAPPRMIFFTTSLTPSFVHLRNSPTAAKRSATQGPEYRSSAASLKTVKSIVVRMPPRNSSRSAACRYSRGASSSPKNFNCASSGMPNRNDPLSHGAAPTLAGRIREYGSFASKPRATSQTVLASTKVLAKIETQSRERQAGTTPVVLKSPRVGLRPTRLLNAAGTPPEPAGSVPRKNAHKDCATATADPELDPPEMYRES